MMLYVFQGAIQGGSPWMWSDVPNALAASASQPRCSDALASSVDWGGCNSDTQLSLDFSLMENCPSTTPFTSLASFPRSSDFFRPTASDVLNHPGSQTIGSSVTSPTQWQLTATCGAGWSTRSPPTEIATTVSFKTARPVMM